MQNSQSEILTAPTAITWRYGAWQAINTVPGGYLICTQWAQVTRGSVSARSQLG